MVPGARETVSVDSVASGTTLGPVPTVRLSLAKGPPRTSFRVSVRPLCGGLRNQQTRIARGKSEPGLFQRL
jgi:hypothetical protein